MTTYEEMIKEILSKDSDTQHDLFNNIDYGLLDELHAKLSFYLMDIDERTLFIKNLLDIH